MTAQPGRGPRDRFDRPDLLLGAARLLAVQHPGVWQKLLVDHVCAHDGRCRVCRPSSGAAPIWPCRLAVLAAESQRLATERPPGKPGE